VAAFVRERRSQASRVAYYT